MVKSQEPLQVQTWKEYAAAESARLGIKSTPRPMLVAQPEKIHPGHIETMIRNAGREQHTAGEMNGLEKRYAAYLETRRLVGEIVGWRFEPLKLKLAPATFYNVDFSLTMLDSRIELHETKGFWRDDARVKIKVAAARFTEFRFVAVQWKGKQIGWKFEVFG